MNILVLTPILIILNKKLTPLLAVLCSFFVNSQSIIINELDADTPSTDILEFVELKTSIPNMALDGFVVVFFNGSTDKSYAAYNLDGYSSNINGIFLLGNSGVCPTPNIIFNTNFLQNGADAVAIYKDNVSTFPNGTLVTTTNLIDALVYDTNQADDIGLLTGLNQSVQYNEAMNGNKENHSLQRKSDGTFEAKISTAGVLNDGSGVTQNSITISSLNTIYNEGDVFEITFSASEILTTDLDINFTLANTTFTTSDYAGNLKVTILSGSNSACSQITIIDDAENEDIENVIVSYVNLDFNYIANNNNYTLTIYDNDYTTSTWGTPINPTYGLVSSTAPDGYYSNLDGKSGQMLKDAITAIIADPLIVRAQTYGDIWDILKEADENPDNNNQVWLIYTEQGRHKSLQQGSDGGVGKWNREHIYPQSRGGFTDGTSTTANGKDIYMTTDATYIEHAHGDAHSLRPADPIENSTRNNNDFGEIGDEYNGPTGNIGSWKGDVARALMFMTLRYSSLSVVAGNPDNSTVGEIGDKDYLLAWNTQDPPDDYEMHRNNVIYDWQKNRNPFIDLPELFDYVFGSKTTEVWNKSLSSESFAQIEFKYSNPVSHSMKLYGVNKGSINIYDINGRLLVNKQFEEDYIDVSTLRSGMYFFNLITESNSYQGKIIKM